MIRRVRAVAAIAAAVTIGVAAAVAAQAPSPMHRVFLKNGHALPSVGEAAQVGDRLVFSLWIGMTPDGPDLALLSLPLTVVDLERTTGYALSVRAAHYAATRGDSDVLAMTVEVERSLARLREIVDPNERVRLAQEARRRLLEWSAANYRYRAAEIDELALLFDDVIDALREDGVSGDVTLDFEAPRIATEALLPAATVQEATLLALAAVDVADQPAERRIVLERLEARPAAYAHDPAVAAEIRRRLAAERTVDGDYARLADRVIAAADAAAATGDVAAIAALRDWMRREDQVLGGSRPADLAMLEAHLAVRRDAAASFAGSLARYRAVRAQLLAYERRIRPVTSSLDGLTATLRGVRDAAVPSYAQLTAAGERLDRLAARLAGVAPPAEVADVHGSLLSAVHLARESCARARIAIAAASATLSALASARPPRQRLDPGRLADASAAAAGALLLIDQARGSLIARLFPPRAGS